MRRNSWWLMFDRVSQTAERSHWLVSKVGVLGLSTMLLFAIQALAQNSGTIQGTVTDAQGAMIPGATVIAIDQAKATVARQVTSGAEGLFVLQPLQPGTYTIRVQAKGMKSLERREIVLDNRQVLGLGELRLEVGATTENVTVEAVTPLVETATSDRSAVIDSRQVTEISMNGRDFQSLVRTLPGVTSNDASDFRLAFNNTDSFHINGMRGSDNNFFLDGAVNTDVGANDGQFTQLSMDAVGEFKVQTSNFSAEYGRNPGVLLAANTKSGGRQFHGTLYEFNREDGFDANYFFNRVNSNGSLKPTPVPNSKLRFNQYGFNIGGPIPFPHAKDKLFFFFNFEGTRALRPNGGQTYNLPDPKWLGIGTPNGDADFSSALKTGDMCAHGFADGGTCAAGTGPIGFRQGQIFQPGTIQYNAQQEIINGTPFAGNVIPKAQFGGQYAGFLNVIQPFYKAGFFGAPGSQGANGDFASVTVPFQDTYTFDKHQEVARIDFNINPKTNFFFRWVDDSQKEAQDFGIFSWGTFPALPQYRKKPGSSWSWNLVNVISPTITNEFIFSYNHLTQVVDVNTSPANYDKTQLGFTYTDIFPGANLRNVEPGIIADYGNLVHQSFPPEWTSEARMFTWTDNLTKVAGPHTFKAGAFFDYNQAGQQPAWQETPVFDFVDGGSSFAANSNSGVANLVLGNYYSVTQSNGVFFGGFRFHQLELYGQDSWKVNRKLTLDYGLRWAYLGPTYTVKPFFESYFDPNRYDPAQAVTVDTRGTDVLNNIFNGAICTATMVNPCPGVTSFGDPYNGMVREGQGIPPGFVQHRHNNFGPRFGFAWDPTGSGKMAIRGGAGVFYERVRQNVNSFDGLGNPPLAYQPTFYNGTADLLSPSLASQGALLPVSVRTPDKGGQIPTTYSWSIGVQRELPWQLGLDVAYVGNQARHLQYIVDLNQFPVGTTTGGVAAPPNNTWLSVANYRGYTQLNQTIYGANSSYNALQTRLSRRFGRRLTMSADYTYAKTRDLSDTDDTFSSVRDRFNAKLDYGPAGWDRPHVFNINYVYDFPDFKSSNAFMKWVGGGWEVSGITRFWSGTPFSLTCGGTSGATGGNTGSAANPFCDYLAGAKYASGQKDPTTGTLLQWINPYAFAQPAQGTIGNTTRNEFRGPGYNNWNMSLFKNLQFSERVRLQLRLETFNTFNHVQFGGDNGGSNIFDGVLRSISSPSAGKAPDATNVGSSGKLVSTRDPRQVQLGLKLYF